MTNTARVRSLILAIAILAAACGGGRTLQRGDSATVLEVQNRSTLDMNIYAIADGGARERLGTVTSLSTARFEISARMVSSLDLRFAADPVGSARTAYSERLSIVPGDTVVLEIPAAIGR